MKLYYIVVSFYGGAQSMQYPRRSEEKWGWNGEEKAEKCKITSNWLQKGIMQPNNVGMGNKQQRGVGVDEEEERADNKEANFRRQQEGKQLGFKYSIKYFC